MKVEEKKRGDLKNLKEIKKRIEETNVRAEVEKAGLGKFQRDRWKMNETEINGKWEWGERRGCNLKFWKRWRLELTEKGREG